MLRVVELEGLERRRPRQLSGGQQQRVALARALVNRPAALLLDEPLGALDVKLRKQMQLELKRIQHELGTTFVYVTHDQEEALAMSDRIAVMNGGRVEQIGSPREIYEHPQTAVRRRLHRLAERARARSWTSSSATCRVRLGEGERIVVAGRRRASARATRSASPSAPSGPHRARPALDARRTARASTATIAEVVYLGMYTQFHVETRGRPRPLPPARGRGARGARRSGTRGRAHLGAGRAHVRARSTRRRPSAPRLLERRRAGRSAMPSPDLGCDDDDQRDGDHDHGDGDHLRQLAREAQRARRGRSGTSSCVPTTNEATAYSSNEVVNAIRNAETTAGRISGRVIERNVRSRLAPRSYAASSSETSICSSRGTSTRIVYGTLMHDVADRPRSAIERGNPTAWKKRSSEIPKTT